MKVKWVKSARELRQAAGTSLRRRKCRRCTSMTSPWQVCIETERKTLRSYRLCHACAQADPEIAMMILASMV